MKKDAIASKLQFVTGDTRHFFEALTTRPKTNEEWHVMNPFDDIYRLVYRLTMRTLGSFEIAENPKLLDQTLSIFEQFEKFSGPSNVIFPWLPTIDYFAKLYLSFRLFWTFRNIVKQRERTGKRPADAVQFLLDAGSSMQEIVTVSFTLLLHQLGNSPYGIDTNHSSRSPHFLPARSTAV
jgi:sterol 14-demethylase